MAAAKTSRQAVTLLEIPELRAAYARGLESIKARNRVTRNRLYELGGRPYGSGGLIGEAEAPDVRIQAARAAIAAIPVAAEGTRFHADAIAELDAAQQANPIVTALLNEARWLYVGMARNEAIEAERDAKTANDELRRRGVRVQ